MPRPKILVVDDDYSFAEFAKMLLDGQEFDAVIAQRGKKALDPAKVKENIEAALGPS